jgi:hypothetical protein
LNKLLSNYQLYLTEYELLEGNELLKGLNLIIGDNKIARYNCCLHKANLCVRKAINLNEFVKKMFKTLSSFASQSNKVIALVKLHREKKSKLQKEQHTRFSSSFLMLYSVLVAHKRKVFGDEYNNQHIQSK